MERNMKITFIVYFKTSKFDDSDRVESISKEMFEWCRNNNIKHDNLLLFYFENKKDAMLFKLKFSNKRTIIYDIGEADLELDDELNDVNDIGC